MKAIRHHIHRLGPALCLIALVQLTLLLGATTAAVLAEGEPVVARIAPASAAPGAWTEMAVVLDSLQSRAIGAGQLQVRFDSPHVASIVAATPQTLIDGWFAGQHTRDGALHVAFASADSLTADGTLLKLLVQVADTAPIGAEIPFELTAVDLIRTDGQALPIELANGALRIATADDLADLAVDFDGDGDVDFDDFFQLINSFGGDNPAFDIDGDGTVGLSDFFAFAERFGRRAAGKAATTDYLMPSAGRLVLETLYRDDEVEITVGLDGVDRLRGYGFALEYGGAEFLGAEITDLDPDAPQIVQADADRVWIGAHAPGDAETAWTPGKPLARLRFRPLDHRTAFRARDGVVDIDGRTRRLAAAHTARFAPETPLLGANYPNPFNPSTTIPLALPQDHAARLAIYNAQGQTVRAWDLGHLNAGHHQLTWDGRDQTGRQVASGVYHAVLATGAARHSRKLVFLQ